MEVVLFEGLYPGGGSGGKMRWYDTLPITEYGPFVME